LNCVQPLSGIRVLDTSTGPVGGLATMVLADFGADVIKVEPPGGDRFRSLPASPLWLRGKRSVVLDLHRTDDQARLHNLVRHSDVVVVSGPPDRPTRWGIDATGAESLQPGIVHCSMDLSQIFRDTHQPSLLVPDGCRLSQARFNDPDRCLPRCR
jgi:crotonobetainyl-CoA:carnitine CoA-transferase CaiB-like acyl-CoA transferase